MPARFSIVLSLLVLSACPKVFDPVEEGLFPPPCASDEDCSAAAIGEEWGERHCELRPSGIGQCLPGAPGTVTDAGAAAVDGGVAAVDAGLAAADAGTVAVDAGLAAADAGLAAADAGAEPDGGAPADAGPVSVCGDGEVTGDEECDDANQEPGDGCENDCTRTPPDPACAVLAKIGHCMSCHGGQNGSGSFNMGTSPEEFLAATVGIQSSQGRGNQMPYITPGNRDQSFLFLKVAGRQAEAGGTGGDRMPRSGPPFWTDGEVALLGAWIDDNLTPPQNCE